MPAARGDGERLGDALVAALRDAGWSGRMVQSWHAQLSALTKSTRGQDYLLSAGAAPGRRAENWRAWLAEDRAPSKHNQSLIRQAYQAWRLPAWVKAGKAKWSGAFITERGHTRMRGTDEAALLIDHSRGKWDRIQEAWNRGADADEIEDLYIDDVITEDIDFSEFDPPGGGYTVAISS